MLNMGNGLSTSAECYDCVRETVLLFEQLSGIQQMALGDKPASDADIDKAGGDFEIRAQALVLRLAENFGVTVNNSEEPEAQAAPTDELNVGGKPSADQSEFATDGTSRR